jgi:hypothetical protein
MTRSNRNDRQSFGLQLHSVTLMMVAIRAFGALILCCIGAGLALAQAVSAPDFHAKVVELYSFEPHKLAAAEMKEKSGELDKFWAMVKADPATTLPLLRAELEKPENSAFFFYDGSKLLLALSMTPSDRALALRAIAKADLRGVQHSDYLQTIHWFASKGFDTREAAFRILAFPDFKAFIPQHSLTLGQDYSLICMLFAMDETGLVSDLTARLSSESDPVTQKSLLLALWYTATPAGSAAIKAFEGKTSDYPESATYATSLMERTSGLGFLNLSSAQSLRDERRKVMQRPISDEALIEFDQLTAKIIAKQ